MTTKTTKTIKNMEEFASASGISRPTLSKYFNDPLSVRASTKATIEGALEKYEYHPNIYAINQNRVKTKNIGLVVRNLTDPFFAGIARVIESIIIERGYNPLLMSSHGGPDSEIENILNLKLLKPAGVLLAPLGRASNRDNLAKLAEGLPTVLFDAKLEDVGSAFIGSDNQKSVALMVEYLCRSGEPPIFFEMKNPINPNAYKRRSAYIEAMENLGHKPHLVQVEGENWDFEKIGFEGASKLIMNNDLPTNTVLCSNDRLGIGFLAAAFQNRLKVGHSAGCHLRVAGHDDHPFAKYTCPSLTTVSQDYEEIAEASVNSLLEIIDSSEKNETVADNLFSGRLVLRDSA